MAKAEVDQVEAPPPYPEDPYFFNVMQLYIQKLKFLTKNSCLEMLRVLPTRGDG